MEKITLHRALTVFAALLFCQVNAIGQTTLVLGDDFGEIENAGLYACIPCGFANKNYGNTPDFIATTWTKNGNVSVARGLIRFDLSQIPDGATILSAKLNLYHYNSPYNAGHSQLSGSNSAKLYRVTQPWDRTNVHWNNKPNFSTANSLPLPATPNNTANYLNIDLMQFVPNWYKQPASNHGLVFIVDNETHYRAMLFGSANNPNPNVRPRLIIEYEIPPDPNAPDSLIIKIPNVFTPNNDGVSDFFRVELLNYSSYNITIFNRWGSMVFESDDATAPWDGTYQGNEVAEGVYFAIIKATDLFGNQLEKHTSLTLLR